MEIFRKVRRLPAEFAFAAYPVWISCAGLHNAGLLLTSYIQNFKPLASSLDVHGHSGLNWTRLKPLNQISHDVAQIFNGIFS